tara:strand:+ start:270 stop:473 length:204 start_codon:yes stop_codon:yes gene_type:complete
MKYRIRQENNKWNIYAELTTYDEENNMQDEDIKSWDLESWAPTKEEALKEVFHLAMEMDTIVIDVEF